MTSENWEVLLRLLLAQRLEINAIESALRNAGVLTDAQLKEIRSQTSDTATAWSSQETDDVLKLLRIHSSPGATMLVSPARES